METLKAINSRKSCRSYTGELCDKALSAILMAGQAAPIGRGQYDTMHMTVIKNKELLAELNANAADFFGNPAATPLYGAPCLVLVSTTIADPANANVPCSNAAVVVENMTLAATDLGIGSCLIWGAVAALNTKPELVAKLNLPEGYTVCCGITLGEPTEALVEREIPADRIATAYID